MYHRNTVFAVAAALICAPIGSTSGQDSQRLFEAEGVFGTTVVDVAKWARVLRVDRSDKTTYGFNGRLFVGSFGDNRIGFEIGNQQLFTYELVTQVGTTITREQHRVAATHIGAVVRFTRTEKLAFDAGAGFHYFSNVSLFGIHFAPTYRLLDRPRFSMPVGFRMDLILDNDAAALPMTAKAAIAIKF